MKYLVTVHIIGHKQSEIHVIILRKYVIFLMQLSAQTWIRCLEAAGNPEYYTQIVSMFDTIMSDNVQARELKSNGDYIRVENDNVRINSQELFYDRAYEQAK